MVRFRQKATLPLALQRGEKTVLNVSSESRTVYVEKLENSPSKDKLASKRLSGSFYCGRIRSTGSVHSCTVGSRRVKRVASRRGKRVALTTWISHATEKPTSEASRPRERVRCQRVGPISVCFGARRQLGVSSAQAPLRQKARK